MQMSSAHVARLRHQVRPLHARFAIGFENALAGPDLGVGFDERQSQILGHRFRQRLTVPFRHGGFGIVQVQVTGGSFHKQEDHILRFGCEVRRLGRQGIYSRQGCTSTSLQFQQMVERNRPDSARAPFEKIASCLNLLKLPEVHQLFLGSACACPLTPDPLPRWARGTEGFGESKNVVTNSANFDTSSTHQPLVINSSRFNSTRLTLTHAAASVEFNPSTPWAGKRPAANSGFLARISFCCL